MPSTSDSNSSFSCLSSLGFDPPAQRHHHFDNGMIVLGSINIVNSIISSCSNFLVVYTIARTASLRRTPSNILILALGISDLVVSLVSLPSSTIPTFSFHRHQLFCVTSIILNTSMFIFSGISFFTLTAITIDRFLAVQLHLRYQELVTTERYIFALLGVWIFCISATLMRLFIGTRPYFIFVFVTIAVFLQLNMILIFKIYRVIRRHSVQIQAQQQSVQQSIDMPRYKKSVNTMYFVIGAFLVCYVPFAVGLLVADKLLDDIEAHFLFALASSLVMFNSVLNPIIYVWRIAEIRNNAVRLVTRICKLNEQQMTP